MGSQSQSHHSHIKHLASLNSSPNCPCMLVSFFFLFFFWGLTHTHYSIFSLCLVFKKIKRENNIGYCSLCCLSFILLCKGWNFWFVFDWEGERNFGFCDLCCWGSCKDERLIESWAKWVFMTKIEEFDFFYNYMVAEKIWENWGMWKKKKIYIYIYIYSGFNDLCSSCLRFMWIERETNTTFWFCFFCIFVLFFVLRGERQFEQKYLFTPDFNKGGLRKTNGTYYRWVKWYFSNHG